MHSQHGINNSDTYNADITLSNLLILPVDGKGHWEMTKIQQGVFMARLFQAEKMVDQQGAILFQITMIH